MTSRPIGVFDSGVGGLSVLDTLIKTLPNERFVYIGDTAHMPYGERSTENICQLVSGIEKYLLDTHQAKMLTVACNTSAGILANHWQTECPVPVIEPVQPISEWLIKHQKKNYHRIGLLATQGTIQSGRYQKILEQHHFEIIPVICTGFAKLVEDNTFNTKDGLELLEEFLRPLAKAEVDAIVLGCTHYPFAVEMLQRIWQRLSPNNSVTWLNPADQMAVACQEVLKNSQTLSKTKNTTSNIEIFVTGSPEAFHHTVQQLPLCPQIKSARVTHLALPGLIEV